jgi:hypothetical protein
MSQRKSAFLEAQDRPRICAFLDAAPAHEAVLIQNAAHDPDYPGWWYGVIELSTRQLHAVACAYEGSAFLYGANPEDCVALGAGLLRDAGRHAVDTGHDHHITAARRVLDPFWESFQKTPRQLRKTQDMDLYRLATPLQPESKTVSAAPATAAQLPLLEEWTALLTLEAQGFDPRKLNKAAHTRRCQLLIEAGQQWVATQQGAPALCAEIVPAHGGAALIERAFAPRPTRRPKLLQNALAHIAHQAQQRGHHTLFCFEDTQQGFLAEPLQSLGFTKASPWRHLTLR